MAKNKDDNETFDIPEVHIQDKHLLTIAGMISDVNKQILRTKSLYDLMMEFKATDGPNFFQQAFYNYAERKEMKLFQKKHLARRINEYIVLLGLNEFLFTDGNIDECAKIIPMLQQKIQATRALLDLMNEYKRDTGPAFYSKNYYTEDEMTELCVFQKKRLLRRIQEEAVKAGFTEFNIKD